MDKSPGFPFNESQSPLSKANMSMARAQRMVEEEIHAPVVVITQIRQGFTPLTRESLSAASAAIMRIRQIAACASECAGNAITAGGTALVEQGNAVNASAAKILKQAENDYATISAWAG